MKRIVLFYFCLLSVYSFAQTLHHDDMGVKLFYTIEKTNEYTFCRGSERSDKNFSNKRINIWKITISLENRYSGTIIPRAVGIANISVYPDPIKPYLQNYCKFRRVAGYGPNYGYLDQSLFRWPIRDYTVKEVKPGEVISNMAYLYLYEGQTPKLSDWEFSGYRFKKDFRPFDPILVDIEEMENKPKTISPTVKISKERANAIKTSYVSKIDDFTVSVVKLDQPSFSLSNDNTEKVVTKVVATSSVNDNSITPTKAIVECPGEKANSFKEKSNSAADPSEQRAFSWLALYYTYICECKMGSPRSSQLVPMINNVVDSYSANTNDAYGKIEKVTECVASTSQQ